MTKLLFSIAAVSLLFSACSNTFNQVVDVKLPPHTPQLVLNAYFTNLEHPNLNVSNSVASTASNNAIQFINNADVKLFENSGLLGKLNPLQISGTNDYIYINNNLATNAQKIYSLEVNAPNYPLATASDTMPEAVQFTVVKTGKIVVTMQNGIPDSTVEIKLTFDDPAKQKDYYRILILDSFSKQNARNIYFDNSQFNPVRVISTDPIFQQAQQDPFSSGTDTYVDLSSSYFNDEIFDGTKKEVYLRYAKNFGEPQKIYIVLQKISRATYLRNKATIVYLQNEGNPFAQPTLLFSNVKNGYGILGCGTIAIDSLQ